MAPRVKRWAAVLADRTLYVYAVHKTDAWLTIKDLVGHGRFALTQCELPKACTVTDERKAPGA